MSRLSHYMAGLRWAVPRTACIQIVFYHQDNDGFGAEKTYDLKSKSTVYIEWRDISGDVCFVWPVRTTTNLQESDLELYIRFPSSTCLYVQYITTIWDLLC
jgi:hypothetical protein